MMLLYLVGCPLVCVPPPVPHLQLVSFVYQYHQLSIIYFVVKLFILDPKPLHLEYPILFLLNFVVFLHVAPMWLLMHSQLLKGLKCEPKQKATEKGGVGARSLAHNTLRGRRACWTSGMGLRRVDKLHSLTRACTQPTQSG